MIQRGPSIFTRNSKTNERSTLLRAVESAISIALSMTPLGLLAFAAISGS